MIITADDVPIGRARVFADGVELTHVHSVDVKSGVVVHAKTDENGDVRPNTSANEDSAIKDSAILWQETRTENLHLEFTYGV